MQFSKQDIDTALNVLAWAGGIAGVLWLVTSLMGAAHRRTYNLTHADSGRAAGPSPDFLSPDAAKRRAAIARGQAYDQTLSAREAAAVVSPAEQASWWARMAALSTALLTLLTAIVGTVTRVDAIDAGIQRVGSVESFLDIVNRHKAGAAVAFAIIGTHIVVFVKSQKKTLAGK